MLRRCGKAQVRRADLGELAGQAQPENAWAAVKANLDTVTERAAAPIVAKYTGVLAAADIEIFTYTTTFQIMQSLRLDTGLGVSRPVNP